MGMLHACFSHASRMRVQAQATTRDLLPRPSTRAHCHQGPRGTTDAYQLQGPRDAAAHFAGACLVRQGQSRLGARVPLPLAGVAAGGTV